MRVLINRTHVSHIRRGLFTSSEHVRVREDRGTDWMQESRVGVS